MIIAPSTAINSDQDPAERLQWSRTPIVVRYLDGWIGTRDACGATWSGSDGACVHR